MPKRLPFLFLLSPLAGLAAGCAGPGEQTRHAGADPALERLLATQQHLEMRVDEVARQVLALRDRIEAQEAALKAQTEAQAPAAELPSPTPVQVESLPPEPSPALPAESTLKTGAGDRPTVADAGASLYRQAIVHFRGARYGQAILDLEEFLRKYPGHEYADGAQYWIGEAYYVQGEYEQSAVEFNRVVERYPQGPKAPDALLKIGLCYQELGDKDKALVFWKRLASHYPGSEAAHQAKTIMEK